MNKQQLANKIWESANKMRSKIEANEYKDYILGFIFYKFLSDKEVDFLKKDGYEETDLQEHVHENNEELVDYCQQQLGYERTMISHEKHKNLLAGNGGLAALRDSYVFEFLDLEKPYKEKDLRHQIVSHLKDFILEFGHDFTFVGEEYRVQVGNTDFFIDLLFYNRALSCLVAIESKIDTFRPEHLGQLNFYLEVLDRDVKKPNENPSVGLVLCTGKDDTVVEYALSRSMSPTMVADYTLHLPDKTILQNKLRELTELALESGEGNEGDEE